MRFRGFYIAIFLLFLCPLLVLAWDPPAYGDQTAFLASPVFLSGPLSVASSESPMADILNPAASAEAQRVVLDLSYLALLGLGDDHGWGHSINAGIAIPQAYGVWTFNLGFLSSPFDSVPLGSVFSGRAGLAKEVYDSLNLGIGLNLDLGDSLAWGFGFDIGGLYKFGDRGFFKDIALGFALRNMGIAYDPEDDPGINGAENASGFASPFTPAVGIKTTLLKAQKPGLGIDANIDFSFPAFSNMIFSTGLEISIMDAVFLRAGWSFNLAEQLAGIDQGLLPSFGIGGKFMINRASDDSYISRQGWDRSEIRPSVAAGQLPGDVWAIGGGVNMPLGVVDRTAPAIKITYPETEYGKVYISPNSDGIQDEIVIPISITDQRYVDGWKFRVMDSDGNTVREIVNKDIRPESQGIRNFFDRLFYLKKGVPVPSELVWNGQTDAGALAEDGEYSFILEASDDNGNQGSSALYSLVVDTVAPELELVNPSNPEDLIFSPDGDGNKDSITFQQGGSHEDLWTARILDSSGNIVMTWESQDAEPAAQTWDGMDDSGRLVNDGVYTYRLSSVDRAGNASTATIENIIVNTTQPPVSLSIDMAAFSPNNDGIKDRLTLLPDVPVKTGISSWSMAVINSENSEVWTYSGSTAESLPEKLEWDGKDSSSRILPEGKYRTRLVVSYINGHRPEALSAEFLLDITPPSGSLTPDRTAFNPLGESRTSITITQSSSTEEKWLGEILNAEGQAVKSWSFIARPDEKIIWDGSDDAGRTVKDGNYTYRLSSTDTAGNYGFVQTGSILVDTEKKAVRVSTDRRAFSPNGDGVNDTLGFEPEIASAERVKSWTLSVADRAGSVIKTFRGTAAPGSLLVWDGKDDSGKIAKDGIYIGVLEVRYTTDEIETAKTVEIDLDTVAPSIEISTAYTLFSPNGDGRKDTLIVEQRSVAGDNWEGRIVDEKGNEIRKWNWKNNAESFSWDATDSKGNKVPDGSYNYIVSSSDAAGNSAEKRIDKIVVDTRATQVFVTASSSGLSPNGNKISDDISFGIIVNNREGIQSWSLEIIGEDDNTVKKWSGTAASAIPSRQLWDGKTEAGQIADQGRYTARLSVDYLKGDLAVASSGGFVLDTEGPRVAIGISPRYFSPDNDGVDDELKIALSVIDASPLTNWTFEIFEVAVEESASAQKRERSFFVWSGKGKPSDRLVWDGRSQKGELVESATDYPYRFTIRDELGNATVTEGIIQVDVLVIRDGDRLKIKVPSIVFRPNYADFKDLSQETVAKNNEVLERIANILNRFSSYKIRVEGHANSIAKMTGLGQAAIDREESGELIPLSESRARAVMQSLIDFGVDARRLSAKGLGSSEPVVDFKDAENRWKNRRVEFILIKE